MPHDVATAVIFGRLLSVFHGSVIMRFRLLHMRVMLPASVVVSDFRKIFKKIIFRTIYCTSQHFLCYFIQLMYSTMSIYISCSALLPTPDVSHSSPDNFDIWLCFGLFCRFAMFCFWYLIIQLTSMVHFHS